MAIRENVPVIALSQLNRQVDSREDHRPRMSDLRESGLLEQDADLVILLYREDYYREKEEDNYKPSGTSEVIVSKNCQGPVETVRLVFVNDFVRLENGASSRQHGSATATHTQRLLLVSFSRSRPKNGERS